MRSLAPTLSTSAEAGAAVSGGCANLTLAPEASYTTQVFFTPVAARTAWWLNLFRHRPPRIWHGYSSS
jgi:hypothetical protein